MTFINCGISLTLTDNTHITTCIFQNTAVTYPFGSAVQFTGSGGNVRITNSIFQNNSPTYINYMPGDGGALWLDSTTGNVSIINCTFQNNSATYGGGVWLHELTGILSISDSTFENNSATYGGGAVCLSGYSVADVRITNCTFHNNVNVNGETELSSDGGGGAVWLDISPGYVSITDCTFQSNSATYGGGGAVGLSVLPGAVSIKNCKFDGNRANINVPFSLTYPSMYGGGAVWFYGFEYYLLTVNVSITHCIFQSNSATNGSGGAVWLDTLAANFNITNCTFQNNSATYYGGGAVWLDTSKGIFSIEKCTFQNNSAIYEGGAIHFSLDGLVSIDKSTFINNTAVRGAAVYASNINGDYCTNQLGHLILKDVIVENNLCYCDGYQKIRGGAIYFSGKRVDIIGDTSIGSQFSSNSLLGAIQGENGLLQLHGHISFTNNTGEDGGAISLSNNVPLHFDDNCRVEFYRNVATGFGGAIYNDGTQTQSEMFNLHCIISFFTDPLSSSITFTDNHAQQGGHAVYATPIYECICIVYAFRPDSCVHFTSYLTISPLPQDLNAIQVLSFPSYVQLCGCSDPDLCNITGQYEGTVTTYPGRTVRVNVTSVDDGNNLSPSVVYTLIGTNGDTTTTITLGPGQEAQWIGTVCGTIEYQIFGSEMASLKLVLSSYPGNFPTVIEVKLLSCEPGFIFMSNSSTCDCSPFLTSHGVVCDVSDGTVTINTNNWIGVYNNTLPALASTCPLDYCNSVINKLSLERPGDLCNGGRTGIICGHCYGNYSVIFGSSKCQVCTDMWLITLVMFAVLGVLLVAALFFLNLTVTQGTLYGLIFYANIVQVNTSIFFNQSTLRPLQVIVSFVNLDLGIPMCFYDGMDDADKAGLQFVFPAYLLILTMTVIVLCHYCLQRSPASSTRSCAYKGFIIIGKRAVGVLSTLIYLSYSKLYRTVIEVFTYSTVHLPSGDMYVWFYDGNEEYLHGKHSVLFVVAMVTCVLFLLPYTFALTFIPIIEQYSEHNRLFNYLHKKTNQIKPMNDAHYAPYKGEWRWWLGARLWLLVVMYSFNPVLSSNKPSLLMSIQATMVILFMLVQAKIEPFGKSLQKSEKCNSHTNIYNNLYYNSLDLFYLLNYIALALSTSYILDQRSDQTQLIVACVGVLVGLYVVVVMVTVLFHLIVTILKAFGMYDRAREKIDGLFHKKHELVVPATNTYFDEREPLLCED